MGIAQPRVGAGRMDGEAGCREDTDSKGLALNHPHPGRVAILGKTEAGSTDFAGPVVRRLGGYRGKGKRLNSDGRGAAAIVGPAPHRWEGLPSRHLPS